MLRLIIVQCFSKTSRLCRTYFGQDCSFLSSHGSRHDSICINSSRKNISDYLSLVKQSVPCTILILLSKIPSYPIRCKH